MKLSFRSYKVIFQNTQKNYTLTIDNHNKQHGLRFVFDIKVMGGRHFYNSNAQCVHRFRFSLYNLSQKTRNIISINQLHHVEIYLGHKSSLINGISNEQLIIADGQIVRTLFYKNNTFDTVCEFEGIANKKEMAQILEDKDLSLFRKETTKIDTTRYYNIPTPKYDIFMYFKDKYLPHVHLTEDAINTLYSIPTNKELEGIADYFCFKKGTTIMDALRAIIGKENLLFISPQKQINILKRGQYEVLDEHAKMGEKIQIVSAKTGMIGIPEMDTANTLSVATLLNTNIVPFSWVKIISTKGFNSNSIINVSGISQVLSHQEVTAKVISVQYKGDTHAKTNGWITKFKTEPIART